MQDFKQLRVWRESIALSSMVYATAASLPRFETYGIASQMRRSSVSIASNIAEGCGRDSHREFRRFLRIAYGSACELETQARIAVEAGIGGTGELNAIVSHSEAVRRMLAGLIASTHRAERSRSGHLG